ncbi:zinc finger CCCH domain-containing protein 3 [Lissotriton helveticus]
MAEKESLRRQIELLQGLINKHKNVHGNAPAHLPSTTHTWRNPALSTYKSQGMSHAGPSQRDNQQQHQQHEPLLQPPLQQQNTLQQQQFQQLQTKQQTTQQKKPPQLLPLKAQQQKPMPHQPQVLQRKLPHQPKPTEQKQQVDQQQNLHQKPPLFQLPLQHQQQKLLQSQQHQQQDLRNPRNAWRKKYSLVNKPQVAAIPPGGVNVPSASSSTLNSQDLGQKPDPKIILPKRSETLTVKKELCSEINQSVWTSSALNKQTTAVQTAQKVLSMVNPGTSVPRTIVTRTQTAIREEEGKQRTPSSRTVVTRIQTAGSEGQVKPGTPISRTVVTRTPTVGREEQGKPSPRSVLLSKRLSPVEAEGQRKQTHLKQQSETSISSTSLVKVTRSGNSATKWTSELSRTRSESALALSNKLQKSLPAQELRWTPPGGKPATLVLSPQKAGSCGDLMAHSNPTLIAAPATTVNPLKRRLVTAHKIFSPQKSVTPTPSGKVFKCRKTKYTWVANSVRSTRTVRKSSSPKTPESAKKTPVGGQKTLTPKVSPKGDANAKSKKTTTPPRGGASGNKYRWKAATAVQSSIPSKSKFRWHAEGQRGRGGSILHVPEKSPASSFTKSFGDSAHPGYKVKSRTKIIRRKSFTSSPTDKKSNPLPQDSIKSRYYLRRRTPPKMQTVKKISPKGLVQISRHRLRRLPVLKQPSLAREGSSPPAFRSPPSTRVIKTRYKIVTRSSATPASLSPTLLWKARKLAAARWLLANRMRQISPTGKPNPLQQQRWKCRGLRCIGGVMYRVSDNKLSKHTSPPINTSNKYFARSGRYDSSPNSSSYISPTSSSRSATPSRYIASRAVQRSLAIIRQAKQKKEKKKEYCMYYNRFGKCNRGESCPYIHDPDKVAVCTRFLRGTCKKTDGTCSFSHKLSKDKMPVCSFFLRGICNNNNCPYSHVYVSKKAEVCPDFLKGYCPMAEKCKKKHTLVCPDFAKKGSCPRGSKCKLQHRQHKRPRRQPDSTEHPEQYRTPKQARPGEGTSRVSRSPEERSLSENAGPSGLQKLPSFISLKSSPTSPVLEEPTPQKEKPSEDSGKTIQIKPRL